MVDQNFKIVCIINNPDDSSRGLVHTFNHDEDSDLNVFVKSYLYYFERRNLVTKFGYDDTKPKYLLISEEKVEAKQQLSAEDKWEILFVCDSIPLINYPTNIFDENTLLMYHTTPPISNHDSINSINHFIIKKGKKGQHEPYEYQGYQRLLKLTEAYENGCFDKEKFANAKQNVIDWFGINDDLEAKLELLHNCLVIETIPETLDSLLSSYNEVFSIFKKEITEIKEIKETNSPFNKEYIEALTTLRNALLDS